MRSPLEPEVQLDVLLSAICGRNQYTRDPAPVVAELVASSRGRGDILARVAGIWSGYHDAHATRLLADALREIPGAEAWVAEGRRRRRIPTHGAPIGHENREDRTAARTASDTVKPRRRER